MEPTLNCYIWTNDAVYYCKEYTIGEDSMYIHAFVLYAPPFVRQFLFNQLLRINYLRHLSCQKRLILTYFLMIQYVHVFEVVLYAHLESLTKIISTGQI